MKNQVLCFLVRAHIAGLVIFMVTLLSGSRCPQSTLKSLVFTHSCSCLCELIQGKCSHSICGVFGPLFSSQSCHHSSTAACRHLGYCSHWSCRRGQSTSCSCQYWGIRVSWGCRDSVPTIFTHSNGSQQWPATQQ